MDFRKSLAAAAVFACALSSCPALAGTDWRLRAREHFESGKVDVADDRGNVSYQGFLSVFDLWRESPYRLSYGLSVHRGHIARVGWSGPLTETGLGAEAKWFPQGKDGRWFARAGLLATAFDPSDSAKEVWTYGFAGGLGVELPVWKLGLAPEVGGKFSWGARGRRAELFYAALGVHFYVFQGDSARVGGQAPL